MPSNVFIQYSLSASVTWVDRLSRTISKPIGKMPSVPIDEGGQADKASIPLATREGTWIRNVRKKDRAPESMKAAEAIWKNKFQDLRTRSLSAAYNCFGLVFAFRRTWLVEPIDIVAILDEDGYKVVQTEADVEPGDVALYRQRPEGEIEHVAIVLEKTARPDIGEFTFLVVSQWGQDGEYIHSLRDVPPQYGTDIQFASERRMI